MLSGCFLNVNLLMRNELVQLALEKIGHPEVLINIISRRVRQLGMGFRPLVAVGPQMTFMDVALKEVAEEKLSFEALDASEKDDSKKNKKNA